MFDSTIAHASNSKTSKAKMGILKYGFNNQISFNDIHGFVQISESD